MVINDTDEKEAPKQKKKKRATFNLIKKQRPREAPEGTEDLLWSQWNVVKDNPLFYELQDEEEALSPVKTRFTRKKKKKPGIFAENIDDPQRFMDDHKMVFCTPLNKFCQITRKSWLWYYYEKMLIRFGKKHFDFLEECVMLPRQKMELALKISQNPKKFWIIKPPGSSQGQGIFLINSAHDIPSAHKHELMAQRYMDLPYLIGGCKFDLRIYVLITSVEPLRIYVYDEGLVRFCVNEYSTDPEKINDNMMHVCNYDVNKHSDKFTPNEDPLQPQGHKWTLTGLWKYLASEKEKPLVAGCLTIPQIWEKIEDVVVKSVLCGLSSFRGDGQNMQQQFDDSKPMGPNFNAQLDKVKSSYNSYRLFGYDILLDSHRRPHLIEINAAPACYAAKLDAFVNRPMISEMFRIVGYHVPLSAISNPKRLATACKKLNISPNTCKTSLGFNPAIYSSELDEEGKKKQSAFSNNDFNRDSYKDKILEKLTRSDVRVLIKTAEEFSQANRFIRVFPRPKSHEYFRFFDSLPYYDKLLDAFEMRYSNSYEEGIKFINRYCQKKVHLS